MKDKTKAESLQSSLPIGQKELDHFEAVYAGYRKLHEKPDSCRPMLKINTPVPMPTWEEKLADPLVMLQSELDKIRPHLVIGDDTVPSVRVQFGTAQIAAAFGCDLFYPQNNLPAAGSHVLEDLDNIEDLQIPELKAGLFDKLYEWTDIWKQQLPPGVQIQIFDVQSAFNSAHLIRGNEILIDFYDDPDAVQTLLDKVTEFMLKVTRYYKPLISDDTEFFLDWGSMWKGTARISNCSMQMISPEFYEQHVLPKDVRYLEEIGGGRMHYCGITARVIDKFFEIPCLSGFDFDTTRHDFFEVCEKAPEQVVLTPTGAFGKDSPEIKRMLAGDWPSKRNLVIPVSVDSVEEGIQLLHQLKRSMP